MKYKISIRNRIFLSFSLMIIVILVCTNISINFISENVYLDNAVHNSERELALITNNLDSKITHIFDYAVSVAVDDRVIKTLQKYPAPPKDVKEQYKLRAEQNKVVSSIMGLNRNIAMWDLVALNNQFFSVSGYNTDNAAKQLGSQYFSKNNTNNGVKINGPFFIVASGKTEPMFTISKAVIDLDSMDTCGYIVFFVKESSFASIFEDNMPPNTESKFYILNENNYVLSSSEKDSINTAFFDKEHLSYGELQQLYKKGYIMMQENGVNLLFTMTTYDKMNWKVIDVIPMSALLEGQTNVKRAIVISCIIGCSIALFLAFMIAHSISKPILGLAHTMRKVSKGDLRQTVNTYSNDEIGTLYSGFNSLMEKVNDLLSEVYAEQEEKSNYQFKLIQSQIKPHFLYNTLETIKALIDLEMNETASKAVSAMAAFYRLSLSSGNDIITIENEINLVKQYLYIQKLRYEEYLDYKIHSSSEVKDCLIPKLTLQPILENAIYHGIKEKQEKGMIELFIEHDEKNIVFTVVDSGVGMDPLALQKLQDHIKMDNDKKVDSFGLSSINARVQLLYGKEYGISIESKLEEYTKVTLIIPKNSKLSANDTNHERRNIK